MIVAQISLFLKKENSLTYYDKAAECCREKDPERSARIYEILINKCLKNDNKENAAKYSELCGNVWECDLKNISKSTKFYHQAAELYLKSGLTENSNRAFLKAAENYALDKEYITAFKIYEKVFRFLQKMGMTNLNDTNKSYKEYFFKASLLTLCDKCLKTSESLDQYFVDAKDLEQSHEFVLIENILQSREKGKMDIFYTAVS
ncbi:putative vesicular-fusion protein sec17 [Thelohanellus kitauei]|uniref:Putative vesicular-fusion protein sec17 n=1 Tax=Thelohanellus kitauei TaxID=669202 RepID=A0A0C2MT37_THEKT|nr:putative vesicular-fusion protein sec17 [Thelohanellus kitauei]